MEGEFGNFVEVLTSIFVCIFYSYSLGKIVPKGKTRLLCVLPVVCLFLYLPLHLSSVHLGGATAFFISWLGSFKLLLFAFDKGPLASDPSISIGRFMAIACLPIEIQENPPPKPENAQIKTNPSPPKPHLNGQNGKNQHPRSTKSRSLNHVIKGFLLAILIGVLYYSEHFHPKLILVLHCLYIYLLLEFLLAMVGVLARALLGLELKPHFNEPYLSTSLQDFWGRRWNLMATSILRPAVYEPVLDFSTRFIGRKWAPLPAVMGSFVVSGLMHELIYYYQGRVKPTWEVTLFFILQGLCLTLEIVLKKALRGRFRLPTVVSVVLTVGFVVATCFWLFFPQFLRSKADVRMLEEYVAFGAYMKNVARTFQKSLPSS
ncbi:putative long-chain-alcohol O-fatty-acyltransferase [Rosa chinensis]|uniref:Putative long-chain-alcohol O-fatty-acyltransferase n=1 Tax=Rosa chinensis TaxID=74649 RepID=A0A2P6S870_ROSCH|nr:acyl-CoA--sterol O-acyltransferase 1 [Rosa chinensis]PRQ54883.1 putative long-chain-alcohol O-fatty-acyltransferase [Rosa chinensis]